MNWKSVIVVLMFTVVSLTTVAQITQPLDPQLFNCRVGLVSEFMQRFNGEAVNPMLESVTENKEIVNLCQLFDSELVLKNRSVNEPEVLKMVNSILDNNVKIHFEDTEWFATAECVATFKGKTVNIKIYLTVECSAEEGYRWVISNVEGDILSLAPPKISNSVMLLPNEHEQGFMGLPHISSGNDRFVTLYSSERGSVDELTVFNTLVYYGYLNIEYVSDLEFTFLQVPGYIFSISEIERPSTNSGWLITKWSEADDVVRQELLNRACPKKMRTADVVAKKANKPTKIQDKFNENAKRASDFISALDGLRNSKDPKSEQKIAEITSGHYSFRMSGDFIQKLAKLCKFDSNKNYTLDILTTCILSDNNPYTGLSVSGLELFESEDVNPMYRKFQLISGNLEADGETTFNEKIVFLFSNGQLVGIKSITECF